jgi:hypothetical protein
MDLSEVADSEDDLCRLLEETVQTIRLNQWKRVGFHIRDRWDRYGPGVTKLPHNGWELKATGWQDHCSRLITPKAGKTYVSEPYNLDGEGLRDLAELSGQGWDVHITAWRSTWYPGHTLAIELCREKA